MSTSSALDRPVALAELVEAAALDEVLRGFAELHAVGLAVADLDGRVLAQAGETTPLCQAVRGRAPGLLRCEGKLREVHGLRPGGDVTAGGARCDCFTGLRYLVSPLLHEGTPMGELILGPFLPDDRPATLTGVVQTLLGKSLAAGHEALLRMTPLSEARARQTADHVVRVVAVLLHTAYARHLTAQLHTATIAETYRELSDKNQRLAAAVERMQEVDRLKSNFLATVSHELRTPLTSVIGYSEMLIEGLAGALNPEQREYVQIIMEKGDHLLTLITGLLDLSRMDSAPPRLMREPLAVVELAGGVLQAMIPLARRKRVDLRVDPSSAASAVPRVLADRDKLRQVLFNLISNAIKFTPEGGKIMVSVALGPLARDEDLDDGDDKPQRGVRIRVADSGIGIAPEEQVRIFEPFFQVDSSSTREYGGTGLGLTLVKSYVEAHGGRVWVESELGRGSAFIVTLPAADADDAAARH